MAGGISEQPNGNSKLNRGEIMPGEWTTCGICSQWFLSEELKTHKKVWHLELATEDVPVEYRVPSDDSAHKSSVFIPWF